MNIAVLIGAVLVAFIGWIVLFGRGADRGDIWPRTWAVAGALIAFSLGALAVTDRLDTIVGATGPLDILGDLGIGVAVGVTWLAATHIGHAVLCRLFPSFIDQVRDLYGLGVGDAPSRVIGPIAAMAVAEELLFRGVVQGLGGIGLALAVYTAVQFVERNWALALAALLGGIVWGGLAIVTDGLVAPIVAHGIWTLSLTLVVPLRGCDHRPIPSPADRVQIDL